MVLSHGGHTDSGVPNTYYVFAWLLDGIKSSCKSHQSPNMPWYYRLELVRELNYLIAIPNPDAYL